MLLYVSTYLCREYLYSNLSSSLYVVFTSNSYSNIKINFGYWSIDIVILWIYYRYIRNGLWHRW